MRAFFLLGALTLAASTAAAQGADGKALYEQHCKKCHGVAGKPSDGIKKMNPKIETMDAAFFAKKTDADLVKGIGEGKGKMKPFNDKLKPDEMAAVAKYIRSLKP
ncbi:MAG: cytochrome c [Gemmatimonadaceae bacterium]|jgi:mono/diheme cytochrome c family protein